MSREFSDEFREAREAAGLSQKQAADYLKVSTRSVEFWEAGDRVPSPDDRRRLLEDLGNCIPEPAEPTPRRAINGVIDTTTAQAAAAASAWAEVSRISPPPALDADPRVILARFVVGDRSATLTQRRHALQWLEILGG